MYEDLHNDQVDPFLIMLLREKSARLAVPLDLGTRGAKHAGNSRLDINSKKNRL